MTSPRELMRIHVDALFTRDAAGDLVRVNEPDGAPAPRFFLGRTADGDVLRFRHGVGAGLRRELAAAAAADDADPPTDAARYEAILARAAPVERTEMGPAFIFPARPPCFPDGAHRVTRENAELLRRYLPAWLPDVLHDPPMFAVVVDGDAVAVCCSVRQTDAAHEAGVDTAPAFRGRGYAARAAAAWAHAVRELSRVPLYSTSWQNAASRAVARKLGLVHFGSDLHIT
jgi:RimJ/RimL family protein N-acetyltransferase